MTQYITPVQVLFLHSRLITETGGEHGVRDLGMLLAALGRPQPNYVEKEFNSDHFSKTAALFDSLMRNHPFVDGNKRTAIITSAIFLRINGYRLVVENHEIVRFTMACAQLQLSINQSAYWFKRYSIRV